MLPGISFKCVSITQEMSDIQHFCSKICHVLCTNNSMCLTILGPSALSERLKDESRGKDDNEPHLHCTINGFQDKKWGLQLHRNWLFVRIGRDYIQWALKSLLVCCLTSFRRFLISVCFFSFSHSRLSRIQNDKSSTPGLKSNTPTPRNDAPTPGTSTTPGLRPILGKPPMEALRKYSLYTHTEPILRKTKNKVFTFTLCYTSQEGESLYII